MAILAGTAAAGKATNTNFSGGHNCHSLKYVGYQISGVIGISNATSN